MSHLYEILTHLTSLSIAAKGCQRLDPAKLRLPSLFPGGCMRKMRATRWLKHQVSQPTLLQDRGIPIAFKITKVCLFRRYHQSCIIHSSNPASGLKGCHQGLCVLSTTMQIASYLMLGIMIQGNYRAWEDIQALA